MAPGPTARPRGPQLGRDARALFGVVLFLVCFGVVMVYSATSARAIIAGGDQFGIVSRQLIYAALGFGLLWATARMRLNALERLSRPLIVAAIALLLFIHLAPASMVPIIGGATRWIVIGGFQLQPSEVAKLALIVWIGAMIARDPKVVRNARNLAPIAIVTGLLALLVVTEPDLGTAAIIVAIAFAMTFVAGAPVRVLGGAAVVGVCLAATMIAISPYQQRRVVAFLNPWQYAQDQSFQAAQAQIAVGRGGLVGVGLGNSIQKNNYLPEAHTDMISAIVAEELGLLGLGAVMLAFAAIGVIGFRIARKAARRHHRIMAVGVTSMLCLQGGVNLAQVIGAFPITGVPLPFVSYGGSNLLVSLTCIGILINISKQGAYATRRGARPGTQRGDRSGRDGRPRQAGARDRGRIAS